MSQSIDREDARIHKKRPRPVLSCFECRRKKLKCDRLTPCDQCKKSGRITRCVYLAHEKSGDDDSDAQGVRKRVYLGDVGIQEEEGGRRERSNELAGQENRIRPPATTGIVDDVEDLKARVAKLERILGDQSKVHSRDPHEAVEQAILTHQPKLHQDLSLAQASRQKRDLGMLVKKGNRSRYHAPDQKLPMLCRFEDVMKFIRGMSKEPMVRNVMKEVKLARRRGAKNRKTISLNDPASISDALRKALPSYRICQVLTSIYFARSEQLLKILHRPTFLARCKAFWEVEKEEQPASNSIVDSAFLPQLVAVVLIASRLYTSTDSLTDEEILTVEALSPEDMCDILKSWLNILSPKGRLELSTIQIQCLLLIAQQILHSRPDRLGDDSAALVRSAMTMGLHRDSRDFPSISLFEGELRRRVWVSVMELDIQISYASGGRPMVREDHFNILPPARLDDDEIFEGMTDLLLVHNSNELKDIDINSHFYAVLANTCQERLRIISFTSNSHTFERSQEVVDQGFKLQEIRDNLRKQLKCLTEPKPSLPNLDQHTNLNSILLYVYTIRPLLSLYRQQSFHGPENSATREIEEVCVESSMDVLSFLQILKPEKHNSDSESKSLELFHILCEADIMQAALTVCLAAKAMCEQSPTRRTFKCISGDRLWSRKDLADQVQMTVESLIARKQDPRHDIRDPWCLGVIVQYLIHMDNALLRDAKMHMGAYNTINSYLESLRQATANSGLDGDLPFELKATLPLAEQSQIVKEDEMMPVEEVDMDMNTGGSEFDMDGLFDFGFSGNQDWQQGWL